MKANKTIEFVIQQKTMDKWFNTNAFDSKKECKDVLKYRRKLFKDMKLRAVKRTISEQVI